jgi:short-subunit dehydrogenase
LKLTGDPGNIGLGKQTIAYLAAHSPARIYLAARTASKAESAISDVQREVPSAVIEYLPLDLTSFASRAEAAAAFKSREHYDDPLWPHEGGI